MQERLDTQLLQEYAGNGSEQAFCELVARYTGLVYSAALRQVASAEAAQDVAQTVFIDLAKRAGSLARTGGDTAAIVAWLHRATRFATLNYLRADCRRQQRERQVMNDVEQTTEAASDWDRVRPALDEIMANLNEADRQALLLRFFKNLDFQAVGRALGLSDDAAQKRVSRALEKLRGEFMRRGVSTTSLALSAVLSANAVQVAPAGLAASLSSAALASVSLASAQSAAAASIKIIAMTTTQKITIGAVLALVAGTAIFQTQQNLQLRHEIRLAQDQQLPSQEQVQQLERARNEATNRIAGVLKENSALKRDSTELLALRNEVSQLRRLVAADQKAPPPPAASGAASPSASPGDTGLEVGQAIVAGEPGAVGRLLNLAREEQARFRTNSVGLTDSQRDQLSRETFQSSQSAFGVITASAVAANTNALSALNQMMGLPELRGRVMESLGALATAGNNDALSILLNGSQYGFPQSGIVGALVPAAAAGNQQAIEALISVTRDSAQRPLWMMAANGLTGAAESGNSQAIDALAGLLAETNQNIHAAALAGLKSSAARENSHAQAALRSAGF